MARLQRMKWLATGLLCAAGVVYVVSKGLEPRYPWLFYVSAAAEAAMIGAIADWFAVVAMFHHPLNLRFIPHTAVIPRNKARIARGMSEFIQQNFLSAQAVVARIAALRPARTLCGWLVKPQNAETLAGYAVRLLGFGLALVDEGRVRGFLHRAASERLRQADIGSAAAQILDVLTQNKRHHALLDEALAGLDELLGRESTRAFIAAELAHNAPFLKMMSDLFHLRLDEKAARKIVDVAVKKIGEVRHDGEHELRKRFDAFVAGFIERLKRDEALRAKVARLRDEALANPALAGYIGSLWQAFRDWLDADLRRPESAVRRNLALALMSFSKKLDGEPSIQAWIDEQILAALPTLVEEHRSKIGRFIEDQINAWQETRLVEELERHIGPDLQFIRINGTVVGALAGLAIASLAHWLA